MDSRPDTTVLIRFFTVRTKTFENDRIASGDGSITLSLCYKHKRLRYFFIIDAFSMKTLRLLVWMEVLNASKCVYFKRKRIGVDGA